MATILVKGIPEDLLKELKKLKVEMNCRTWAELLAELVKSERTIVPSRSEVKQMAVYGLSRNWIKTPNFEKRSEIRNRCRREWMAACREVRNTTS